MTQEWKHEFEIDRSKWLPSQIYNKEDEYSKLYNTKLDRSCCIGCFLQSLDYSTESMAMLNMPHDVLKLNKYAEVPDAAKFLVEPSVDMNNDVLYDRPSFTDSEVANKLARLNDRVGLGLKRKEAAIAKVFAENGVKVTFTGEL